MKKLFRGRNIQNDSWIVGGLLDSIDGLYILTESEDCDDSIILNLIEVHPYTVGQYMGAKDCTGCAIFEGDILNTRNNGVDGFDEWDLTTHNNIVIKDIRYDTHLLEEDINSVYHISRLIIIGSIQMSEDLDGTSHIKKI